MTRDPGTRDVVEALESYRTASAELSCGSSSCPHSRDRGGQMVNGPCRCYPRDNPMTKYVFAASRLSRAVRAALQDKEAGQ